MKITKELRSILIDSVDSLEKQLGFIYKANDIGIDLNDHTYPSYESLSKLISFLLDDNSNDEFGTILEWWLYECKVAYDEKTKAKIDLSTAEKLVDYLIENKKK